MGCATSKQAVTPAFDHSGAFRDNAGSGSGLRSDEFVVELDMKKTKKKNKRTESGLSCIELDESSKASCNGVATESASFRLGNLQKYVEGEQVAAGWPPWLSAVAGEAIQGWVPLKADSFEKLEKIGQGTYSSVFRARDLDSGRVVALKKVRFDNFEPESVRFMAREIFILRRLDHPNIIKLEGIVTSRLSCSIYLVFEYMEHDISGLLSCPDIKFSEAQVKCYMKQLLSGLEHCHSRGVMHRDIKGANLLVNNEGVLKVGDFGLANFFRAGKRQPLTSRVVTLWYRPPELLLGATDYGPFVDIWSVGCLFAELLLGNPILQGRTEVEQLHKIFKLCGSPNDDYWKKTKLPHATLFKPQQPYESCLWESFKELPKTAVNLIETLLSVEPNKRGTATSALASEYFITKPYACDSSSLPKYQPSKEIDAKYREEARKRSGGRSRGPETTRRLTRKQINTSKLAPEENLPARYPTSYEIKGSGVDNKEGDTILGLQPHKPSIGLKEEASHIKNASHGDISYSGPLEVSGSSGFAWAKRRLDDSSASSRSKSSSRSLMVEPSGALNSCHNVDLRRYENGEVLHGSRANSRGYDSYELAKNSSDASDGYHSQELSLALSQREELATRRFSSVFQDHKDRVEFSGPILSQSHKVDELLKRHERQIRQAIRRTWFQIGKKHGKKTEAVTGQSGNLQKEDLKKCL